MTVARSQPLRVPALAQRLRVPVWIRSQERMREQYGFDLSAPDAAIRATEYAARGGPDADLLEAAVLATRGDTAAALAAARGAVQQRPDSARAHTTLAALLINSSDSPGALAEARRAAELDAEDPQVVYNLGLAEYFVGERGRADDCFRRVAAMLDVTVPPRWQVWRR